MPHNSIYTTIPLKPSEIAQYCKGNSLNKKFDVTIDLSDCNLKPNHIMGYLANLKIPAQLINFDYTILSEYIKSQFFIGPTNLAKHHANALFLYHKDKLFFTDCLDDFPKEQIYIFIDKNMLVLEEQKDFILSLPGFLRNSSTNKSLHVDLQKRNIEAKLVGVNIARLIDFDEFFVHFIAEDIFNFNKQYYYEYYFDKYIYDGDKLIQLFLDNPNNLLINIAQ